MQSWSRNSAGPTRGDNSLTAKLYDIPPETATAFATARISREDFAVLAEGAAKIFAAKLQPYHYYYSRWPEHFPYRRIEQRPQPEELARHVEKAVKTLLVEAFDKQVGRGTKKHCSYEGNSYGTYELAPISWGALYAEAPQLMDSPEIGAALREVIGGMAFHGTGSGVEEEMRTTQLLSWHAVKIGDALPPYSKPMLEQSGGVRTETPEARMLRRKHRVYSEHLEREEAKLKIMEADGTPKDWVAHQRQYVAKLEGQTREFIVKRGAATDLLFHERHLSEQELTEERGATPLPHANTAGGALRFMRESGHNPRAAQKSTLFNAAHDLVDELALLNDRSKLKPYLKFGAERPINANARLFIASRILTGHQVQETVRDHKSQWDAPEMMEAMQLVAAAAKAPLSLLPPEDMKPANVAGAKERDVSLATVARLFNESKAVSASRAS